MSSDISQHFFNRLTRRTLALILAGGRGNRLKHLTQWRAKPAIPFGGKFRVIDFPLSNCINSGIRRIQVLTQYKAHSLILHLQRGWGFMRSEFGEFVELLPAQQRHECSWYKGTADAVYQNLDLIRNHDPDYVLILAGDHIYKMDYGPMLAYHVEHSADLTIGCVEIAPERAREFGIMSVDEQYRIMGFAEKPEQPQPIPGRQNVVLASMGIYVFSADFLERQLRADAHMQASNHDFGLNIIPTSIGAHRVYAYPFHDVQTGAQNYWRDVGTVDAYWEANMELIDITPPLNLYDQNWPIWTYQEQLPPAKFVFNSDDRRGMALDSMVSGGCIVSGGFIDRSLLFSKVTIESHSKIANSVILPNVHIGERCRLNKVIIDEDCVIPDGTIIGDNPAADAERFHLTPQGVLLVTPEMLLAQNRSTVN